MLKGRFIVLDGIDFCGKGTQCSMLMKYLSDHPFDQKKKLISVLYTREPSNSPFNSEIRNVMQSETDPNSKMEKLTELFIKDRKYHIDNMIRPNLEAGVWIVCDRYMYSTLAYQHTQGMSFNSLLEKHVDFPTPDAVFIIDVPGKVSLERKAAKKDKRPDEMFDKLEFQTKLADNYRELKNKLASHPIAVIDGNQSREEIFSIIKERIDGMVKDAYEELE